MLTPEERFIHKAIRLARLGIDQPSREPLVGAVIVADDRVVGSGYANERRSTSAIIAALDKAGRLASGATLYTNIEPCYDGPDEEAWGRRLVECRLARMVAGATKENGRHSQRRNCILNRLINRRMQVDCGVCEQDCMEVNEKYCLMRNRSQVGGGRLR